MRATLPRLAAALLAAVLLGSGVGSGTALADADAVENAVKKAPLLDQIDREGVADVDLARRAVAGVQLGRSYGSGLVVEPGLVLTSTGVVSQASDKVVLWLPSRRRIYGKVVAIDRQLNAVLIAYQAIPADETRSTRWADSDAVRTGQMVYSLGNPFGTIIQTQQIAASSGLVSGRYRIAQGDRHYDGELIETTAAINPGSFGGPVVDLRGRVVGIAHRGFSYRRWLGAVIPAKPLRAFVERFKGGVAKIEPATPARKAAASKEAAFLGVRVVRAAINLRTRQGVRGIPVVRISALAPDGPAQRAGLKVGDVLMFVGQRALRQPAVLDAALRDLAPGDVVKLTVLRREGRTTRRVILEVTLGSAPY